MAQHRIFVTLAKSLLFTLVGLVTACSDKAKPAFDECVTLEAKEEVVKARTACQAAASADPNSKSGKAAQGKLAYLNPQADKILREEAAKNAPCTTGKYVTHCMYQGKPRPTLLEGKTLAECNRDAHQMISIGMTCPVCVCSDRFVEPYTSEE